MSSRASLGFPPRTSARLARKVTPRTTLIDALEESRRFADQRVFVISPTALGDGGWPVAIGCRMATGFQKEYRRLLSL
jgi:hypothetical protein